MKRFFSYLLIFFGLAITPLTVSAHPLDQGLLELKQTAPNHWAAIFKIPSVGNQPMSIRAKLPDTCSPAYSDELEKLSYAYYAKWEAQCSGPLTGQTLTIEGLENTSTSALVRIAFSEDDVHIYNLTPELTSLTIREQASLADVAKTYFVLGVEHILLGIDHLLFVLALILLVSGVRRLVMTVTAFTIAHSITLILAALGVLNVPGPPVEAVIALSIVFLARELTLTHQHQGTLTSRFPWLVAFSFGLLHGLGFAGALAEIGLPANEIPAALLTFNLGVEAGQLLFIFAILTFKSIVLKLVKTEHSNLPMIKLARSATTYVIGAIAAFWLIERVAGFW